MNFKFRDFWTNTNVIARSFVLADWSPVYNLTKMRQKHTYSCIFGIMRARVVIFSSEDDKSLIVIDISINLEFREVLHELHHQTI